MNAQKHTIFLESQEIILETGAIARQAGGSVLLHSGDTTILATACASKAPLEGVNFLPLRVDYQEKFSSAGKTLGGFIKREGRPTEREILVSRFIDRPIRPLFEEGYHHDIQLLAYVYSFDPSHKPDVLAICAASCALCLSDIPFKKSIGAVRVGRVEGKWVLNPSEEILKTSELDLVLAGTEEAILMIEGFADFLTEEQVLEAVEYGHKAIQKICQEIDAFTKKAGKPKSSELLKQLPSLLIEEAKKLVEPVLKKALQIAEKGEREKALSEIEKNLIDTLSPSSEEAKYDPQQVMLAYKKILSSSMRDQILEKKVRIDGRKTTEIRSISGKSSLFPRTHGSALFTRGETQSIAVCTLGGESMGQRYETLEGEGAHRFYMQYFFPPFSVGEVGRMGPPGRRELGHGKLAERALEATLPSEEAFPYVIRLESNITESNGSSSMASVCGGCLAMMDAGVPIKRPVAGIAMGLILEEDRYEILSDILGVEDALGDMDFKIAGDEKGITAFQMDIKVEGITPSIMKQALFQAKEGRIHILQEMLKILSSSREELSEHAPRIERIQINPNKIAIVIGPGGKQIRAIIEETGVDININDSGIVSIASNNPEAMEKAKNIIHGLTAEAEKGKVYKGKITSIVSFGLFVEILPGKEGLCHISQISHSRIQGEEELKKRFKVGDLLEVKVTDITDKGVQLSHKVLLATENLTT